MEKSQAKFVLMRSIVSLKKYFHIVLMITTVPVHRKYTAGRTDLRTGGLADGRTTTDGRTEGRTDGRTDDD